jgi:transcriptional regulator with XRE-family HTH domain
MEVNPTVGTGYSPYGTNLRHFQRMPEASTYGATPIPIAPGYKMIGSALVFGTCRGLTAPISAASIPHCGTSPLVEDSRLSAMIVERSPVTNQGTNYRQLLIQSFGDQAKMAMAALSLTKTQLAGVLRVSRPTIYEWLGGKDPSPVNADRLTTVLRLLTRTGISSESPLNARFVRQPIHERSASLIELLCAEKLDEATIEEMLRETAMLGHEAQDRENDREKRLHALGYEVLSSEQRRDQLNQAIAMLDWPK